MFAACNGDGLRLGGAGDLGAACASATDAVSCQAIPGCEAVGCPSCNGGTSFFSCLPRGESHGAACSAGCGQLACSELSDGPTCDARPDCYALYSGDLPCDNSGCTNHFVKCEDGPSTCVKSGSQCAGSCAALTPSCRAGYVEAFPSPDQTCCSNGCVSASKCAVPVACTADDQCGANAYCEGQLKVCRNDCQLTIGTSTTGVCHRSCVGPDAPCSCVDDADCPGFFTSCDLATGTCKSIEPPICHSACPAGCTDATDLQYGEICVCSLCSPGP